MLVSSYLVLTMISILSTGEFSDFDIKCDGYVFKAHKNILSCRSPFFKAAVSNGMRVSQHGVNGFSCLMIPRKVSKAR